MAFKKTIGLSDLINRLKQDLLTEQAKDQTHLFSIDEVTVELNFVISGDIDSGFNFGVVTLGSQVSEDRIQKLTLKLTPLVPREQLIASLNHNLEESNEIIKASQKALFRTYDPNQKSENQ